MTPSAVDPDQELFRGIDSGMATLEVVDDFSSLSRAVSRLVKKTRSGMTDVLIDRPFDGGILLAAILEEVDGVKSGHWDREGIDSLCLPPSGLAPERP